VEFQREWLEKDYYAVLGVSSTATQKEITKAYRKLARELHPDANPGDAAAEERFKEVSAAYDIVGDEEKRKKYDEVRRLGPRAFGGGAPGGPGGFTWQGDVGDLGDLGAFGDIFGGIFGRRPGAGGRGRGTGPQRGADQEAALHLSFVDAVHGLTTTLSLAADAPCSTCGGSGAKPGSTRTTCTTCGGTGAVAQNQGPFSFSQPCMTCGGSGSTVSDPCATCRGSGSEYRTRDVRVRIPPGVRDGQQIRLRGQGGPGRNGGPAGDLYVTVTVAADARFGRVGNDLTVSVPVTFAEAALGATVAVPTLDGAVVKVKIPPGTPSGKVLRVKGHGVRAGETAGNLLVTVVVDVPTHLNDEQRAAVEALAAATTTSPRDEQGIS
jgi:molecular chaperone DnaJ